MAWVGGLASQIQKMRSHEVTQAQKATGRTSMRQFTGREEDGDPKNNVPAEGSPPVTALVLVSWRARSHRMRFRRSKTGLALGSALGGRHAAQEGSKHPPCEVHVKRPSTACHSLWKGMSLAVEGQVTRWAAVC